MLYRKEVRIIPNNISLAKKVLSEESNCLAVSLPNASDIELLDIFENAYCKAVNLSADNQVSGMLIGLTGGGPEIWLDTYHREMIFVWYCNIIKVNLSDDFCERYHLLIERNVALSDLLKLNL